MEGNVSSCGSIPIVRQTLNFSALLRVKSSPEDSMNCHMMSSVKIRS